MAFQKKIIEEVGKPKRTLIFPEIPEEIKTAIYAYAERPLKEAIFNPDKLTRSMEECGMVYMHAQLFNPAMKSVGPVRKALQVRTIFNLLGPLVNPCLPAYQLLGVADLAAKCAFTPTYSRN